eukprot:scaffold1896_cov121-Isochrysis_galbana.AAC.18
MPSPGSHRHIDVHLSLGVWLQPLPAATLAASRSPRLEYALPRPQQRRHGHRPLGHHRHAPP